MESTGMGGERKDTVRRRQENNKEVGDKRKGKGAGGCIYKEGYRD